MGRNAAHGRRAADAGISLVEVMVVLAIIGVVSGAAMLAMFGGRSGADAEAEARRLAGRLQLAADEALLTGLPRRLDWDATGYRILAWDPDLGVWDGEQRPSSSEGYALDAGLTLSGPEGSHSVLIAPDAGEQAAFVIRSAATTWGVGFDGLTARPVPGAAR